MRLIDWLGKHWAATTDLPNDIDAIAVVSYGAIQKHPTRGSLHVCSIAMDIMARTDARVAYGVFTHSPNPQVEREAKEKIFSQGYCVGEVASTIEECLTIRKYLESLNIPLRSIVVVTGEAHSRSAKLVWETYFPESKISIATIPIKSECDLENPMVFLRNEWAWLAINIIRHIVFSVVGVKRMERFKLRQPTV